MIDLPVNRSIDWLIGSYFDHFCYRLIEQDVKVKAILMKPPCASKGHSRQNSTASGSNRSMGGSPTEHLQDEHFVQWGQIVSEWDLYVKKKNHILKV